MICLLSYGKFFLRWTYLCIYSVSQSDSYVLRLIFMYCKEVTLSDCNGAQTHNHLVRKRALNGWVFIYELSGCGFESPCSHLNFRFRACFEQGVVSHSGNYRVWIHSETRTWHNKKIQSSHSNITIDWCSHSFRYTTGNMIRKFELKWALFVDN